MNLETTFQDRIQSFDTTLRARRLRGALAQLLASSALLLLLLLRGGTARADGGVTGGMLLVGGSAAVWMPAAAVGVISDTVIATTILTRPGPVRRGWAVTGTVVWSVATVSAGVFVAGAHLSDGEAQTPGARSTSLGALAVGYGALAFSAGSLALSIVGLKARPFAGTGATTQRPAGFSVRWPTLVPTDHGGRVLLAGAF